MNHLQIAMTSCRKTLRLTQCEFSTLFDVHPITVSKWERGTALPTMLQYLLALRFEDQGSGRDVSMLLAEHGPIITIATLLKHYAR